MLSHAEGVTAIPAVQSPRPSIEVSQVVLRQLSPTSWMAICDGRLVGAVHLDGEYLVHDADGLLVGEADTLGGAQVACNTLRFRRDTFSYSTRSLSADRAWTARLARLFSGR